MLLGPTAGSGIGPLCGNQGEVSKRIPSQHGGFVEGSQAKLYANQWSPTETGEAQEHSVRTLAQVPQGRDTAEMCFVKHKTGTIQTCFEF